MFCGSNLFATIPTQYNCFYFGQNPGTNSSYTINRGWTLPGGCSIMVGGEGTGYITHSNGTVGNVDVLFIGYAQGGQGQWTQSGGVLNAGIGLIGIGGHGTYTQNNGNVTFGYGLAVGYDDKTNYSKAVGGYGTYQLNDGTLTTSQIQIGDADGCYGTFNLAGGTLTLTSTNSINIINGYGTFNMTGGLLKTKYSTEALANLFNTKIQHSGQVVIGSDGQYSTAYLIPEPTSILLLGMSLLIIKRRNHIP